MNNLRITPLQIDIKWNNKRQNQSDVERILSQLVGQTDVVLLPETFATGFSLDNARSLSEPNDGETMSIVKKWASMYNVAIMGTFIASDSSDLAIYNRAFFISPDQQEYYCDKRHLFSIGGESDVLTPGDKRIIIHYRGFNLCILICYDLRFPVWSRNCDNEYDLLIYLANWPEARQEAWTKLLYARAIENCCYVAGVNRIGEDGNGLNHSGNTLVVDYKGSDLLSYPSNVVFHDTVTISKDKLDQFRKKFPVSADSDTFKINIK